MLSAQTLGVHAQQGTAGALQQPLQHDLAEQSERAAHDDVQVLLAHHYDLLHLGLGAEERPGAGQTQHAADGKAHERQKQAVHRHTVGPLPLSRA